MQSMISTATYLECCRTMRKSQLHKDLSQIFQVAKAAGRDYTLLEGELAITPPKWRMRNAGSVSMVVTHTSRMKTVFIGCSIG